MRVIYERRQLNLPLIDDTIIANIDNIIATFQPQKENNDSELSQTDLLKSLDELKKVKSLLQHINVEASSSSETISSVASFVSRSSLKSTKTNHEIIRNSIEMVKNGGKFTKPITNGNFTESDDKTPSSTSTSIESPKNDIKFSFSSMENAMSVSKGSYNEKACLSSNKTQMKLSRPVSIAKKRDKTKKPRSKIEDNKQSPPKIIKTFHASCRIHKYDDNSHTFEVIKPKSVSCTGDSDNVSSELVIVVLATGETALFLPSETSKHSTFLNSLLSKCANLDRQ